MTTAATNRVEAAGGKPGAASSRELRDLLYPITPEEFTSQYWGRQPIFIKGSLEKLERLFPGGFRREDFLRAVRHSAETKARGFRLYGVRSETAETAENVSHTDHFIRPEEIDETLASGETVAVNSMADERLARFAASIKSQLNHAGDVTPDSTLSPPHHGFPTHADPISNIFIQTEGRKSYWVSRTPALLWPHRNSLITRDGQGVYLESVPEPWEEIAGADVKGLVEFVMEPGDVLYFPAGTIHATKALDEYSLNVILILRHLNFLDLIKETLSEALTPDPVWRHLPHASSDGIAPGGLPEETVAFFAERLSELRDLVNSLTPDSFALNRQWHKVVADPGEATRASLALTPATGEAKPVEQNELLRLSRRAPITYALGTGANGDRCIAVFYGDKEISVGAEWVAFLRTLVEHDEFVAGSATEWSDGDESYPWETAQECLQAMLEQGIIERPDTAPTIS